jgi:hypothetical protein
MLRKNIKTVSIPCSFLLAHARAVFFNKSDAFHLWYGRRDLEEKIILMINEIMKRVYFICKSTVGGR